MDGHPLGSLPVLPEPSKGEGAAIAEANVEGLLPPLLSLPLIKPIGQEEAPPLFEGPAEGWLRRHRLGAGIDHAIPDGRVLCPRRNETPAMQARFPVGLR